MLRNTKIIIWLLLIFLLLSCAENQTNKTNSSAKFSVTDFRGKVLNFSAHPKRVVCLIESALSGIYMLHAENNVAGISTNVYNTDVYEYYSKLDERIAKKELPAPGNCDFVDQESLFCLKPDLVIIWAFQK